MGLDNGIYQKYLTRKEAELLLKESEQKHQDFEEDLGALEKRVTELERFRWKAAGIIMAVVFFASLFANAIWKELTQ